MTFISALLQIAQYILTGIGVIAALVYAEKHWWT